MLLSRSSERCVRGVAQIATAGRASFAHLHTTRLSRSDVSHHVAVSQHEDLRAKAQELHRNNVFDQWASQCESPRTDLHELAHQGKAGAIRLLLGTAAGRGMIDLVDEHGWTAVHLAARQGHVDVLRLLVSAGSTGPWAGQLTAKTASGWTALHLAARYGHAGAIRALVALGAPLDPDGDDGKLMLTMAGKMCYQADAIERKAATLDALQQRWKQSKVQGYGDGNSVRQLRVGYETYMRSECDVHKC